MTYFNEEEMQVPDDEFEAIPPRELKRKLEEQLKDFSDLLNSLDTTLDKKKQLWRLIFENAITDRKNAYMVFADLYINVRLKSDQHAIHGATLSKYMERMSKATDQLLKLAELVAAAEEKSSGDIEERMSDEDAYASIQQKKQTQSH